MREFHHDNNNVAEWCAWPPKCLYALPTMSGHAPDGTVDDVLGDLLPDLDQGISELLEQSVALFGGGGCTDT